MLPIVLKNRLSYIAKRWGIPDNLIYDYFYQLFEYSVESLDDENPPLKITFDKQEAYFYLKSGFEYTHFKNGDVYNPIIEGCKSTAEGWSKELDREGFDAFIDRGGELADSVEKAIGGNEEKINNFINRHNALTVYPVVENAAPYVYSLTVKESSFEVSSFILIDDESEAEIEGFYTLLKPRGIPCMASDDIYCKHFKEYEIHYPQFSADDLYILSDDLKVLEQKLGIVDHGIDISESSMQGGNSKAGGQRHGCFTKPPKRKDDFFNMMYSVCSNYVYKFKDSPSRASFWGFMVANLPSEFGARYDERKKSIIMPGGKEVDKEAFLKRWDRYND